jgi:hypothetical protein
MKAYIYEIESMEVFAVVEGESEDDIESAFDGHDTDLYALTYSPAFGFVGGLK